MKRIDRPFELNHYTAGCYAVVVFGNGDEPGMVNECFASESADIILDDSLDLVDDGVEVTVDIVLIDRDGECWLLDQAHSTCSREA